MKWWKAFFFTWLGIGIANCHTIYTKLLGNKIDIRAFQMRIALKLIDFNLNSIPSIPSIPSRDLSNGHVPQRTNYLARCKVCYKEAENKTKVSRSSYKCQKCSDHFRKEIALCIVPCFGKFHKNIDQYIK